MKMYIWKLCTANWMVLVQILPYNCSQTDYTFASIRPPPQQDSALYPDVGFTLRVSDPLAALFSSLRRPCLCRVFTVQ